MTETPNRPRIWLRNTMRNSSSGRALLLGMILAAGLSPLLANGQEGPLPPGHHPSVGMVMHMDSVRSELKLSRQQIEAIDQLPPPPPPGHGGPANDPLAKILDPGQLHRFHQLVLQFDAPMDFDAPEVAKTLDLSVEQIHAVGDIVKEYMPAPGQGHHDWDDMQQRKAAALVEALKVLSSQQQQAWSQMTGKVFTNWQEPKHR